MKQASYYSLGIMIMVIVSSCSPKSIPGKQVFKWKDQKRVEEILKVLEPEKDKSVSELVVLVGKQLLETPYVGFTVDKGSREHLVINLRGLDCTTFAENCLAISRTVKIETPSFEHYTKELKKIRYRDGILDGYPSRLHYFTEWIVNNEKKGIIKNMTRDISDITYDLEVNFMSRHPESYRRIKKDNSLVEIISEQEKTISDWNMTYIPEERLRDYEDQLQDGDIAGITTSIDGLDIQHVVILIRVNSRIGIMHASSDAQKVSISDGTLEDYLLNNENATGIMVARPLN